MLNPKDLLPKTLKEIRKDKGLSLEGLAKETGVSKAMLGQIERGESSPTLSTLWKIVKGLDISLSTLIEPSSPKHFQTTLIRNADEIRQNAADGGMLISPLFPFEKELGFEYLDLIIEKGYDRISAPHAHGVVEIIHVIEGELEVLSENEWHLLKTGQSIRFTADKEHGYRNLSSTDTKVINVIHYPNKV